MSIERRIAAAARELVKKQREESDPVHKKETEYRSLCESFPILLRSAGLAQSVSYLSAKGEQKPDAPHGRLYEHLQRQFRELGFLGPHALSEWAASPNMSSSEYRLYSEIAMHIAMWHKRLAQAVLRAAEKAKVQG